MRICLLADGYPSEGQQVYLFVQQLVDALVDMGVQVDVISPQSGTKNFLRRIPFLPFCTERKTMKGNAYSVYRPKYLSCGNYKFFDPLVNRLRKSAVKRAIRQIGKNQIDVFYGHFWHNAYALKSTAKRLGKPLFVACGEGDNALEELVASMTAEELNDFRRTVTGVISVSSENKRKSIEFGLCGEDNIDVFPNCVNQDIFHPLSREECRRKIGLRDNDFVVVFVGGFIHRKGSARLSQALSEINDKNIKAVFIGRPMGSDVAMPDYDQTVFQGQAAHDDLPVYLNAADVFVLPTLKEGCCNAIVEAISCGIPVISSNGHFNDDILDDQCSIRINPDSVDEIKAAIVELRDNPGRRESMAKAALKKSADWSITRRAERIADFISSQINRAKKN